MWLFSKKVILKKINDICITNKLPQIRTIADKKKEISYSIYNKLLLALLGLHKNRLIPKVNKASKKRDNAFPTI